MLLSLGVFIYCFMVERSEPRRCSMYLFIKFVNILFDLLLCVLLVTILSLNHLRAERKILDFCGNIRLFRVLILRSLELVIELCTCDSDFAES